MGRQGQAADLDAKRTDHRGREGDTRALGTQARADLLFIIGKTHIGEGRIRVQHNASCRARVGHIPAVDRVPVGLPIPAQFLMQRLDLSGMGGAFDQKAVHLRQSPFGVRLDQPPGQFQLRNVAIDAVQHTVRSPGAEPVDECRRQQRCQSLLRRHHMATGARETVRAVDRVAVQSADPLQQHVDGAEIGEQKIRIDIQTLLQSLRPDHDTPAGGAIFG